MSIIILVLATISFFCFTVLPTLKHRVLYALLSLVIMVLCTGAIVLNDSYNWGMKVQTVTKKQKLVSSVPDHLDVLLSNHLVLSQKEFISTTILLMRRNCAKRQRLIRLLNTRKLAKLRNWS